MLVFKPFKLFKHGTRNAERGTRNAEHGTRNAEHGTRNAERFSPSNKNKYLCRQIICTHFPDLRKPGLNQNEWNVNI